MTSGHANRAPNQTAPGQPGLADRVVVPGLLTLAVCTLVAYTTPPGMTRFSGSAGIRPDQLLLAAVASVSVGVGPAAGLLACLAAGLAARRQARLGRGRRARGLVLTAGATAAACGPMVWAALRGFDLVYLPRPHSPGRWLSAAGLALAGAGWLVHRWREHLDRTSRGPARRTQRRIASCLTWSGWRRMLGALPRVLLWATLACIAASAATVFQQLTGAAPWWAIGGAMALAGAGGVVLGLLLCLLLAAGAAGMVALMSWRPLRRHAGLVAGLVSGALAAGFCLWGLHRAIGDILASQGAAVTAWVMVGLGGLFLGTAIARALVDLSGRDRPADLMDLIRITILAAVLLPVMGLLRRRATPPAPTRRLVLLGCALLACLIVAAAALLYPTRQDFLDRIQFLLAMLVVTLSILLGHLAAPARRRPARARLAMLAVLAVVVVSALGVLHRRAEMYDSLLWVFRRVPMGRYELLVMDELLGKSVPKRSADWSPPKLRAEPTARDPVMDDLHAARPLIVVVLWDAARADRMSVLGYRRDRAPYSTTPSLDRYAGQFLIFPNAFAQASSTTVSLRHLYTGRYSSRWMQRTKGIAPFWTNELIRAGYHTFHLNIINSDGDIHGISTDAFLRDMPPPLRAKSVVLDCDQCASDEELPGRKVPLELRSDEPTMRRMADKVKFIRCTRQNEQLAAADLLAHLAAHRQTCGQGVFAFLHMDKTHMPWSPIPGAPDFGSTTSDLLDQAVWDCDMIVGQLIDGLRAEGLWDNTVLVVTADHGTNLDDPKTHRQGGDAFPWYYRIHIPLLIRLPGVPGRQIDDLVGLFDVGPTLMDVFAPETMARYEGRSLWPLILRQQKWPDRVLFGLSAFRDGYYLVRSDGTQFIRSRDRGYEQLLNWRQDPWGRNDMVYRDRAGTRACRHLMDWFLYEHGKGRTYDDPSAWEEPP